MNSTQEKTYTTSCPDCDLLLQAKAPKKGKAHHCPRCGKCIVKNSRNSVVKALALSTTALILLLPAIFLPLLTMESAGFIDRGSILESIEAVYQSGYPFVAFATFMSAVAFPFVLFISLFIVALHLHKKRNSPLLVPLFRLYCHIEEWAMIEVYLLGIIIALIKMQDMGTIHYETGFFLFSFIVIIGMMINCAVDKTVFWEKIKKSEPVDLGSNRPKLTTAKAQNLLLCHDCNNLVSIDLEHQPCPRCRATLHSRKKDSFSKTLGLVVTAFLFLFPANLLPIMRVDFLGSPTLSTIMDGIIYFFKDGSFFIGLVILIASILVPVYKVIGISILLTSIYLKRQNNLRQKAYMFRCIAFIGRWSMLDIFVIALLSALVNFGFLSSVSAAHAATYFCVVVILTMCAAITFDPRLIWDHCQPQLPKK